MKPILLKCFNNFFYGNYFVGCCVVALAAETATVLALKNIPIFFYIFLFCSSAFFYINSYKLSSISNNFSLQSNWLLANHKQLWHQKNTLLILAILLAVLLLPNIVKSLYLLTTNNYLLLSSIVLLAFLYNSFSKISLRKKGYVKPFIIGLVWSGVASFLPLYYYCLQNNEFVVFSNKLLLLFVQNFALVSALAIVFDCKDITNDSAKKIDTFAIKLGIKNSIKYIVLPLLIVCLLCSFAINITTNNVVAKIIVSIITLLAIVVAIFSVIKPKSIIYYLFVIDGLIILKAITGILIFKYL
jgi:4-hydroxybenzoate polyprenyltransferase